MSEAEASPPRRRPRRALFALVAVVCGVGFALVLGEVGLRVLGTTSEPRRHFSPGIYLAHDELGWTLIPGYEGAHLEYSTRVPTRTNAQGFRGPAWTADRAAAPLRVLALGDSCTFGRGVTDDATFPAQLEGLLSERQAAVFNAGVPGYDTLQELASYERLVEQVDPQLVILTWLPNDVIERSVDQVGVVQVIDGHLVHDVEKYLAWRGRIDHEGLYRSALYRYFRVKSKALLAGMGQRRGKWDVTLGPDTLAYSVTPLLKLAAAVKARGARFLLVLMPRQEEVEDPAQPLDHYDELLRVAAENELEVIDLPHRWRDRGPVAGRFLERDAVHLTQAGNLEVAQAIAEHLTE